MISPTLDANGDGEIQLIEIYKFIEYYVKQASKMKNYSNQEKHNIVLDNIRKIVPSDIYDKYEPMISVAISFIWSLVKSKKCKSLFC